MAVTPLFNMAQSHTHGEEALQMLLLWISSASVCFRCQLENELLESEKGKKSETDETKRHSSDDRGGSTHWNKRIGMFTADAMRQCIAEIKEVEAEAARIGNPPKFSRNQVTQYLCFTLFLLSR